MTDIPDEVLDALELARQDGRYNMLDRNGVISILLDQAEKVMPLDHEKALRSSVDWLLEEGKDRYMEALTAMGERRR